MAAIVLVVALWPFAHAALVARYRIDPWELFGWAMYALPAARVQIGVETIRGDEVEPLRAMGELRERIQRFARRRTALGELASTEPLAHELFAADPSIDALIVLTREFELDHESSLLVTRDEQHRHERPSE